MSQPDPNTTTDEAKAVAGLKRLAARWPASLWLFSGAGTLHIMRNRPDGTRAMLPSGGVDPDYSLAQVSIPNDGGDW